MMGVLCPDCHRYALKITSSLEFPADSWSDEITLQIIERFLGFAGVFA
jgi:hypothetical protein